MSARRWSKFWWQDWQRDPALRMCSLAARGAWIEILCLMADADPVGHLLVNGRTPNMKQLSSVLGCTERETKKLLSELEENGVFSRLEDGTIYSRRMVRDKAISDEAALNGKKGGNPNIKPKPQSKVKGFAQEGLTPSHNPEATPPLKHQETEAEADTEKEKSKKEMRVTAPPAPSDDGGSKSKRGHRLPDDWQPSPELVQFAIDNRVDPQITAEKFRDYWHSVPGSKAVKLDWDATWRNWVRRDNGMGSSARKPTAAEHRTAVNAAWAGVPDIDGV